MPVSAPARRPHSTRKPAAARRATLFPEGGGKSTYDIPSCARDAVAFAYYARIELGQGRVPAAQQVFFGSPYSVRMDYGGAQNITVEQKTEVTDRLTVSVKGPRADFHFDIYFARDPARTPLRIVIPGAWVRLRWSWCAEMRVAFVSPLPPARSGIADYSQALLEPLARLAEVEVFSSAAQCFDAARFDIALYQLGNNACHDFVYRSALRDPGVLVMHESNLHHLMAEITIKRGDWDAYVRECEYEGGAPARAYAERVRRLEVGPDYEGLAMLRRLLENARGVVVHSRFMHDRIRAAGFAGPMAVIPHGAWIPEEDPSRGALWARHKLGLDETTPLIGIFGFLKPYKRIAESLRAFRRLVRLVPNAKMILVGEPHPDFPIEATIRGLGLSAHVRLLGFAEPADFTSYMAACDIVLNLRYPTVGESSGSLVRALGLGKAVLVSEVGSFQELPEDVCLKAPVGAGEEDVIFEYLNLLVSRPDVAGEMGRRARDYVARECSWPAVAKQYAGFLEAVVEGREYAPLPDGRGSGEGVSSPPEPRPSGSGQTEESPPVASYLKGWAASDEAAGYLETHQTRLVKTLEITPPGGPCDRILEMGAYLQITPSLRTRLGYGEIRGCYYGPLGRVDHREVTSAEGESFTCEIDLFDAEKDCFPYPDGHFQTVLCCELIEHLFEDPMHMMAEINRVLKSGGHLVLTTPNIAALRGIAAILQGYHPGFFHAYIKPSRIGSGGRAPQPRVHAGGSSQAAGSIRVRGGAARNRRVSRPAASRVRLGPAPARTLSAGYQPARRRHLRRGAKDRTGARPLPGVAVLMSVSYGQPEVELDAASGRARVRFELRNESLETWRAAEGVAVSYHLFDAENDTLIEDGPRLALERDVAPGDTVTLRLAVDFPPEDGSYQARISLMREGVCWYYDRGWPFLEISVSTRDGVHRLERVRAATRARVGREHALRALGRALVYPPLTLWRNRGLIRVMVRRDILGRYRGSFGGSLWTVINPLLLMLTYYFVFGMVLRTRFPNDRVELRLRALFPLRHAALAGLQRGRRALSHSAAGAPQFCQEAGIRGGDPTRQPGGFRTGERILRGAAVLCLPPGAAPRSAGHRALAAGAAGSAGAVHGRGELVSGGAGRRGARPGPIHRLCDDHLVLHHPHLLP